MTDRKAEAQDRIRIGTSGWSYPREGFWHGVFYPKKKDELKFYSRYFNTAEVNSTFYRLARPETTRAWAKVTPPDFRFAVKAWQRFTHPKMFEEATGISAPVAQEDFNLFKRSLDPLTEASKLGALLVQFPPSFHATPENIQFLEALLGQFRDYPVAVELRHRSWSGKGDQVKDLLQAHRATWVIIDEPKFASSIQQEVAPLGEMLYLRFHGRNREKWWQHAEAWERYDYLYTDEELRPFAKKLEEISVDPRVQVYAFFNNHVRGQAVANALMLRSQVGLLVGDLPSSVKREYSVLEKIKTGKEDLKLTPD